MCCVTNVSSMQYIYGGKIGASEWKENSKDFINAADLYGVKDFKIESEAWYVKFLKITVDNVVEELVYADKKNLFPFERSCNKLYC